MICRTGPDIFVAKPEEVTPEYEMICSVKFEDGKIKLSQANM